MMSAPAVQFKGSGWYVTDYARKSSTPSGGNGNGAAKSEAKPAATSPATSSAETK
jgi:predicted nucleic acid-binding Zn ribbon protein